jgi:hypothetical protein
MSFCTTCNKQNTDSAKFCTGCGAALNNIAVPAKESQTVSSVSPNKKNIWMYVAIASVIIIGVPSYFLFFQQEKNNNPSEATRKKNVSDTTAIAANMVIDQQPANSSSKIKSTTIRYKDFSFGDLAHYTFTDVTTGEEEELEFDETQPKNWETAWNELMNLCSEENKGCPLTGQLYKAEMEYKLADIYDWNGEGLVKTGKKEMRWLVTRFNKISGNNENNNSVSYLGNNGKLIYKSDCFVIITGSFTYEKDVINDVSRMRNEGYSNAGYIWIPDYPSMSGKQLYAPFIGPFQSYEECKKNLQSLSKTGRFWYGLKVSYTPQRVEIRL